MAEDFHYLMWHIVLSTVTISEPFQMTTIMAAWISEPYVPQQMTDQDYCFFTWKKYSKCFSHCLVLLWQNIPLALSELLLVYMDGRKDSTSVVLWIPSSGNFAS